MSYTVETTVPAETVRQILAELGDEWTTEQRNPHCVIATRDRDGLELSFVRFLNESRTRVAASNGEHKHVRYDETRPEIMVTLNPERARAIARDLGRRLMADAEAWHELMIERQAASDDYAATVAANLERLGLEPLNADATRASVDSGAHGGAFGNVSVGRDSVRLELSGVPVDVAAQILELLRKA